MSTTTLGIGDIGHLSPSAEAFDDDRLRAAVLIATTRVMQAGGAVYTLA